MQLDTKKTNKLELVELIEIEKKSLELSESNARLFTSLLESKRSETRENLLLSIITPVSYTHLTLPTKRIV